MHSLKLKIADTRILLKSRFALRRRSRFKTFVSSFPGKEDIVIEVNIAAQLPPVGKGEDIFTTYHPDDGRENWRILKKGKKYIYACGLEGKEQISFIEPDFKKAVVFLLPKKNKSFAWDIADIFYDFLHILLINYFARGKSGIFVHSAGIRDIDGKGFIFAGRSGCGKSTIARIWHRHSRAMVLNDDRIIIRRRRNRFFIYPSPWHGEFSDYLSEHLKPALLSKIFFIRHAQKNSCRCLLKEEKFNFLYPALFPPFWDRGLLENTVFFCRELVRSVKCFNLGFAKDKMMIPFVRAIA